MQTFEHKNCQLIVLSIRLSDWCNVNVQWSCKLVLAVLCSGAISWGMDCLDNTCYA